MKYLFMFVVLMVSGGTFAQKKKTPRIVPPPPPVREAPPVAIESLAKDEDDDTKCFVYTTKEEKEGRVFVTESLLEYGWNNNLARMIITNYDYDPVAEKKANEKGYIIGQSKQLQFIEGTFRVAKGVLTFEPEKLDLFKTESFKILFEGKDKKVKHLTNSRNEVFEKGECLKPMVSM